MHVHTSIKHIIEESSLLQQVGCTLKLWVSFMSDQGMTHNIYLLSVRFSWNEYFPWELWEVSIREALFQLVLKLIKLTITAKYLLLLWSSTLHLNLIHLKTSSTHYLMLEDLGLHVLLLLVKLQMCENKFQIQ